MQIALVLLLLTLSKWRVEGVEDPLVDENGEELPKPRRGAKEQREPENNKVGERCDVGGGAGGEAQFQDPAQFFDSAEGKAELKDKERRGSELCKSHNCRFNFVASHFVCVDSNFSEFEEEGGSEFVNPNEKNQQALVQNRARRRNARPNTPKSHSWNLLPQPSIISITIILPLFLS